MQPPVTVHPRAVVARRSTSAGSTPVRPKLLPARQGNSISPANGGDRERVMNKTLRHWRSAILALFAAAMVSSTGCQSSTEFTPEPSRSITGAILSGDTPFPRGYEKAKPGHGLKMSDVEK